MAVDLNRALTVESYARQCFINHDYHKNTMEIPDDTYYQILATWSDKINSWKAAATQDKVEYEFSDEDMDASRERGKNLAKDGTGYDGGKDAGAVVDAGLAVGGAIAGRVAGNAIGKAVVTGVGKVAGKAAGLVSKKAAESLGTKMGNNVAKGGITNGSNKVTKFSDIATVLLAAVVSAKYWIEKPNKEQVEAAEHLMNEELPTAQGSLYEAQTEMEDAGAEVVSLAEEAAENRDSAQEKIEDDKTQLDFYKSSFEDLKTRAANGQLTPDEKALMQKLLPLMQTLGEDVTATQEETQGLNDDIKDDMGDYQEVFDEGADTMGEVQGVTEFAEGFDESTRTMCYVEGAAQGINAASAGIAAAKLYAKGFWNWAFAAIGTAAAISSGLAMKEQTMDYAPTMSDEIDTRRDVQDLTVETEDIYDEQLEGYVANLDEVDEMELEIPDDMEVPEEATTPTATRSDSGSLMTAGNDNNKNGNDKKDDDDKNKPPLL